MIRFLGLLALVLTLPLAHAQETLSLGTPVPLASQSFDTASGGTQTLEAAMGESGLAVVFWSTACPWTRRYEARLAQMTADAIENGIGFVLVASSDPERSSSDTPEALAAVSASIGAPLFLDSEAALAEAFGATQTPEAFFFGSTLLYTGAIDDSPSNAERVTIPFLQQAMDQHLAGQAVEIEQTTPFGCTLKRDR
ncbi:MAG: redoxin domain-containing protein [Bacteroidota bacterium]